MPRTNVTRKDFGNDRQGRTFTDVTGDAKCPFDQLLRFFNDEDRQRRMEDAEIHHDRAPLAGVVRELEAQEPIRRYLAGEDSQRTRRFRQAVGVLVRMIMQQRGWRKTGRKGSLGVRAATVFPRARPQYGGVGVLVSPGRALRAQDGNAVSLRARAVRGT